ncbi:MAG: SIMPL domain-containing protein [Acidobacteriota bacterium]
MINRTALAVIVCAFLALPAQGQSAIEKESSMLTVSGQGEIRIAPDEATVQLGVTRQRETAREAQEQVNEVAQEILTAVIQLGVEAEHIQTSQLRLSPVYSTRRPGFSDEPRVVAYRASNMVSVRLENLSLVGSVIDAAMQVGGNQLQGVYFALRNDLSAREQALKEAVKEASQKAKAISEALDVKIIEVIEVNEGSVSIRRVPPQRFAASVAEVNAAATPVSPGQLTVSASVIIRYRIGQ